MQGSYHQHVQMGGCVYILYVYICFCIYIYTDIYTYVYTYTCVESCRASILKRMISAGQHLRPQRQRRAQALHLEQQAPANESPTCWGLTSGPAILAVSKGLL